MSCEARWRRAKLRQVNTRPGSYGCSAVTTTRLMLTANQVYALASPLNEQCRRYPSLNGFRPASIALRRCLVGRWRNSAGSIIRFLPLSPADAMRIGLRDIGTGRDASLATQVEVPHWRLSSENRNPKRKSVSEGGRTTGLRRGPLTTTRIDLSWFASSRQAISGNRCNTRHSEVVRESCEPA
jgi:hypothetical protein